MNHRTLRILVRCVLGVWTLLWLAFFAALLAGCGGGTESSAPDMELIGPPDCHANPEACR